MKNLKKYKEWLDSENDNSLTMIVIGYDPKNKAQVEKEGFDLESNITNIKKFSKILNEVLSELEQDKFVGILNDKKMNWFPYQSIKKKLLRDRVKKFLNKTNWDNKYFGNFKIPDLEKFFELYITIVKQKFLYEVFLISKTRNLLINISHHNNIWLISADKDLLCDIAESLSKYGATIVFADNFQKFN